MPVLGGTANPVLGRALVRMLDEQRQREREYQAHRAPDINIGAERVRQLEDPFGLRQTTGDPLYDWGRLAGNILGGKGIVLARGPQGRDVLAEIRRQIGPYLRRLVESPHVYTTEGPETVQSGRHSIGVTKTGETATQDPEFRHWLREQIPARKDVPDVVTRIMAEAGAAPTIPSHEAAHALGIERLRQRLHSSDVPLSVDDFLNVSQTGGLHADILGDPRSHRMLTESLKRWPSLADYYTMYRHNAANPRVGYGELMNEAWAQRQAERMGAPRVPASELSWYQAKYGTELPKLRETYAGETEHLRQTGQLPPTLREGGSAEMPLMQRYQELGRQVNDPGMPNEVLGTVLMNWLQRRGVQ